MKVSFFILLILSYGCGKKFKDNVIDAEPMFAYTGQSQIVPASKEGTVLKSLSELKTQNEKNQFYKTLAKEEFDPYVQEYSTLKNLAYGSSNSTLLESSNIMDTLPINLYDVKSLYKAEGYVAVCRKSSKSGKKEILIDLSYWNSILGNENLRKTLLGHELGHCLLGRSHFSPSEGKRSIMEAMLIQNYNQNTKSCYGNELFFPQRICKP